ncbi:MAG TPA: sigma-54 dependent transcriptional regulator [Gemmatimonadales bacterium]|nr:sigma-54 dependent transcriptional regulator [Gemmatimonadales bacterium]
MTLLCVDDDLAAGAILQHLLTRAGHRAVLVPSADEAVRVLARLPVDLILAEYRTADAAGQDLLARLQQKGHQIPVILLTEDSRLEHIVKPAESPAVDYLTKPVRAEVLEIAVRRSLELVRLRRENGALRRELANVRGRDVLVGDSDAFCRVMDLVTTAAAARAPVLLQGEPGTGKALLARAIHDRSSRVDGPFVTVNCAAAPGRLVESALFGLEGPGAFEQARGGTLLLNRIAGLRIDLQGDLLAVLQEQQLARGGERAAIPVDVRMIATSERDLGAEVEAGRLRSDLHYRLNVLPVRVPSLRERVEDIPRLARHFVLRAAELQGKPAPAIAPETLDVLQRYPWPGNVRELANAVERAALLCRGSVLRPGDLDRSILQGVGVAAGDYDLETVERLAIERALAATGGNRTRAARLLGISERTLRNKLNAPRAASGD